MSITKPAALLFLLRNVTTRQDADQRGYQRTSYLWGLMRLLPKRLLHPADKPPVHIKGYRHCADVRHDLSAHDAIHSKRQIKQKQHGNIKHSPPDHSQKQGLPALPHSLEQIDQMEAHKHKGGGQASDSQEIGSDCHGLGIIDKGSKSGLPVISP